MLRKTGLFALAVAIGLAAAIGIGWWQVDGPGAERSADIAAAILSLIGDMSFSMVGHGGASAGPDAERLNVVFISVDPERDTPRTMAVYVAAFRPQVRVWTDSPEDVAQAANAFRVTYKKVPLDDDGYTMDYTASVISLDAIGKFRRTADYHEIREVAVPKIRLALGDR